MEITWNKPFFKANTVFYNPDYSYADSYIPNPDWGQQGVTIDDPIITNQISNSIYTQTIYLKKPYEEGAYSINADFWNVPCGYNIKAKAKVFIDNILTKVIESPSIIDQCFLTPYWQIFTVDKPSGKIDIINNVDYFGIS